MMRIPLLEIFGTCFHGHPIATESPSWTKAIELQKNRVRFFEHPR
jgi:hypothetical protein